MSQKIDKQLSFRKMWTSIFVRKSKIKIYLERSTEKPKHDKNYYMLATYYVHDTK